MRSPAAIAFRPRPESYGPECVGGAQRGAEGAAVSVVAHCVDPDTLEDEIAYLRDLDLPKHRKCLPGVNERPTARSGLGQQAGTGLIGPASPAELSQKLAALNDLTAPQLRAEWRRLYRGQPPRLSRDLLVRSIAYRIQELAHGGLSKATRRKLLALTKVLQSNGSIEPDDGPNLRPGARLVREWRGRTHTVQVTEDGFECDGKPYSSLSKIAHAITGAHWSGPRFFGLNRKPTAGPQDSGNASAKREDAND
jgi:Protein of unknown function (DUF2924)